MKTKLLLALISAVLLMPKLSQAETKLDRLHKKVAAYFLRQAIEPMMGLESNRDHCDSDDPPAADCISYVAGSYSSQSDRIKAASACIGNRGVECAKYVAGDYESMDSRVASARSCSHVRDLACVKFVAGDYATSSDRNEAAQASKNSNFECVKSVIGSYLTRSDRISAAKACAGNFD